MALAGHRGGDDRSARETALSRLGEPLVIATVVALACLFGILTRPVGFLATVWPANAVMLGLLIRMPAAARASGWAAAGLAYVAVDLATGSTLLKTLLLNGANLVGVAAAYLIFARLPDDMKRLRQPASVLYVVIASAAAAGAAGVVGALANPVLFGGGMLRGFAFWSATEFVNYIAILPVMLAAPSLAELGTWRPPRQPAISWLLPPPAIALALSCLVAAIIGGPGAIAIPVPALLWCALSYGVFTTAMLTLLFSFWSLLVISAQFAVNPAGQFDETALISGRLGASLIALAPVMIAIVMTRQEELLEKLKTMASRDQLTGASNRHSYREKTRELAESEAGGVALIMIDLDHFKSINDTYSHAAGDEVLATFADRVQSCLRHRELFGRLGGEEFAVTIPDCTLAEAGVVAERLRREIAQSPIELADGRTVAITASLGVAVAATPRLTSIDSVLAAADAALYRAKSRGRNRVEMATEARSALAANPAAHPEFALTLPRAR